MTLYYTQQPETYDQAYIIQVYPNGVVLLVPNLGIESPLLFEPTSMASLGITFDPVHRAILNATQDTLVSIYDLVPVKIVVEAHPKTGAKKVGLQWLNMPPVLLQATQKRTCSLPKKPKHSP
jgi:S1 domain